MNLTDLLSEAAAHAKEKGFNPSFSDFIALTHTELSEAFEEYRKGNAIDYEYTLNSKPEGIPVELADAVIRIAHYCGANNIDLVGAIQRKTAYNKTRPYLHGKKL